MSRLPEWARVWAAGAALFLLTCTLPFGPLRGGEHDAQPTLERYGEAMARGEVPYRDFFVEYQPGALAALAGPALAPIAFVTAFKTSAVLYFLVALLGLALALDVLQRPPWQRLAACAAAALGPLLLGPVSLNRFDALPAALVVLGLAFALRDRPYAAAGVVGYATVTKLYPVVIVPPLALALLRRLGVRRLLGVAAVFVLVAALVAGPFAVIAQDGLTNSLLFHRDRPLQIESLGASVALVARSLGWADASVVFSFGGANLDGGLAGALSRITLLVALLVLATTWSLSARRPPTDECIVAATACSVAAFLVYGKVLSPQFLLWLVPLVPLLRGRLALLAGGLLAVALLATGQLYRRIADLWALEGSAEALLVFRNGVLVALSAVLVVTLARESRTRSAPTASTT